jgi:hypothetical protein
MNTPYSKPGPLVPFNDRMRRRLERSERVRRVLARRARLERELAPSGYKGDR